MYLICPPAHYFNAVCSFYIRSLLWVPDTLLSVLELGILIYKINTHKCVHTHTTINQHYRDLKSISEISYHTSNSLDGT